MQTQNDIRAAVTNKIVEALQSGAVPFWQKPWASGEQSGQPTNALTGKPYHGVNWLLLTLAGHDSKWWATYNQWKSLGAQVRRGEKGIGGILYKPVTKTKVNDDGEEEISSFPILRTFTLFHISKVDGAPAKFRDKPQTESKVVDYEPAKAVFSATGADVRFGGSQAFYSPTGDYIQLPPKEFFTETHEFYGVMSHEFLHWTGHESRLNRLSKFTRFGSEAYAVEELVAELGSAYLSNEIGVPQSDDLDNVAAYLGHWLAVLKRDHTAIFTAASAASKASDYIISFSRPQDTVDSELEVVGAV